MVARPTPGQRVIARNLGHEIGRRVVRCIVPAPEPDASLDTMRAALTELASDFTIVGERMPAPLWHALSRPRSTDPIVHGIRRAFDPAGIMNVGILGAT